MHSLTPCFTGKMNMYEKIIAIHVNSAFPTAMPNINFLLMVFMAKCHFLLKDEFQIPIKAKASLFVCNLRLVLSKKMGQVLLLGPLSPFRLCGNQGRGGNL